MTPVALSPVLGKGEGNWDKFCHAGGKIKNNDTGDIACDSYHKYADDVQIIKSLGVSRDTFYVLMIIIKSKHILYVLNFFAIN